MTIQGGGNPILDVACVPRFRMGPPPWSFAADAYVCIMVQLATEATEYRSYADGETLLRTLMAWQRGEPRVCAMTVPPIPSEEDRRRISRERAKLLQERIRHTNRIRGLLFGKGITNYNPLHKNRRRNLEQLRTGDGRSVPA